MTRSRGLRATGTSAPRTELKPARIRPASRAGRVGQKLSGLSSEAHRERARWAAEARGSCSAKRMPRYAWPSCSCTLAPLERDVRIEDQDAVADVGELPQEREHVVRVQVVEQADAEHDVERPVPLAAERAHVLLEQLEPIEAERLLGHTGLLDVRLAPLDRDRLGAVRRELDGVLPLERPEVEHAQLAGGRRSTSEAIWRQRRSRSRSAPPGRVEMPSAS